ncbi:hypothetical protein L6278_00685 [Candidatus Parcubacteria bacterium]|nr:hypothetical protein [Patescibacteria group bacterium]MCG2686635.1 hypothetical protein [Candidatus Parcubacteria bacterium]
MCKRTKKTKKQTRREKFAKRISTFLLAILFLSNFFTFQIPVAQADAVGPNPYSINIVGQIKDSATNNALSNVTVKLLSRDPIDWYLYYDNEGNITDNDCVPDEYFEYYQKGEWCYSVQKTTVSDVGGNYLLNNVHACNLSSPHEWYYDLEFSKDGYSVKTIEDIDEICGITITKNETLIPNEIVPDWRKNILPGDILYDQFASGVGHVGLYIGNGRVIEALGIVLWESGYPGEVKDNPITDWDYPKRDTVYLLRVNKPDDSTDDEWQQKILNAIDFVKYQNELEKPYDWHWYQKQLSIDSPSWYCSELIWAAYYNQGVDLEYRTNGVLFDLFDPVSPVEIFDDEDTEPISYHLEGFDTTPWYRQFAPLFVLSPVNVIITDKDNNVLDQNSNNIP